MMERAVGRCRTRMAVASAVSARELGMAVEMADGFCGRYVMPFCLSSKGVDLWA